MRTYAFVTLTAATLLPLAGCQQQDTVKGPFTPRGDVMNSTNYPKVTIDASLANWVAVSEPTVERGNVMKVSLPVRLLSDPGQETNIQYRFLFFTANGAPARGGDMSYRFMHLPSRDQVYLTGNSLDGDAADWRCEMRLAR